MVNRTAPVPVGVQLLRLSGVAAGLVALIGALVLVGWLTDNEVLKRIAPGRVAMNPLTAVCFLVAASALLVERRGARPAARRLTLAVGAALVVIGLLRLAGYLWGWEVGLDTLLFREKLLAAAEAPNRMAPNTALNFALAGGALLLGARGRRAYAAQLLALAAAWVALLALIGYAFGARELYGIGAYIPMALPTATAFVLLALSLVGAQPDAGLMATFASDSPGGQLARRLLPAAVALPLVLGWGQLEGARLGWFSPGFGLALATTLSLSGFSLLIWWTARSLHGADLTRRQAEAALARRTVELEETTNSLEAVIENLPVMLFIKDAAELRFVRWNRASETIVGWPRAAVLGQRDQAWLDPAAAEQSAAQDRAVLAGAGALDLAEEAVHTPQGVPRLLHTRKAAILGADGRPKYLLGIAEDVTEQRQRERHIRQLGEELARRASLLEAANQELEAFSYSVSHDLRAPLRSIAGFSQILQEEHAGDWPPESQDYLRRIRAAAGRMEQLIDDMLSLARVARSELRWERVDLTALAHLIAAELQPADAQRAVAWVIAPSLVAHGDGRLLRAALENLLGNAWKYTAKQAAARIEFGCRATADGPAYFVRDNGAGFDMAYADKLFGVFQRLHDASEFAGTGVGLAIVQRIVRRHGGRVWAEGRPGAGATFFFTLPAGAGAA